MNRGLLCVVHACIKQTCVFDACKLADSVCARAAMSASQLFAIEVGKAVCRSLFGLKSFQPAPCICTDMNGISGCSAQNGCLESR